ncbi:MAG: diaminopimelate epimerase [Sciscionella sp.]
MGGVEFRKGHGTENDFVLLPDAEGRLALTVERVRALCDRRRGLGADGVLRVVRASAVDGAPPDVDGDAWFMDYRNADGSIAEMCGNGVRLFARHLVEVGLAESGEFTVGTMAGPRHVTVHPDLSVTVALGHARIGERSAATVSGQRIDGLAVDVGNPHLVCVVQAAVEQLDLGSPPGYDRALFPRGVNVEFVNVLAENRLRMRVHERGVGETRSCGTGTVAAVAATVHRFGETSGAMDVEVPGGRVRVTVAVGGCTLRGPAEFVARGELDASWWEAAAATAARVA